MLLTFTNQDNASTNDPETEIKDLDQENDTKSDDETKDNDSKPDPGHDTDDAASGDEAEYSDGDSEDDSDWSSDDDGVGDILSFVFVSYERQSDELVWRCIYVMVVVCWNFVVMYEYTRLFGVHVITVCPRKKQALTNVVS